MLNVRRHLTLPGLAAVLLVIAVPAAAPAAGLKKGTNKLKGGATELTITPDVADTLGAVPVQLTNTQAGAPATAYRINGGSIAVRPGRPLSGTILHAGGMRFTREVKVLTFDKLRLDLKARTLDANVDGARTRSVVGTVSRVKVNKTRTTITARINLSQKAADLLDLRFGLAGLFNNATVLGTVKITPTR